METTTLGKTGLKVSVLGFGCGAVGGLMVRGEPADQERAVARALELGINYFDTAPLYGNGVAPADRLAGARFGEAAQEQTHPTAEELRGADA